MNPEDMGRALDEIGERIGPAGEYAWTLTVRQVVIDGALWGTAGLLLLGLAASTFVLLMRYHRDSFRWYDAAALVAWAAIPGTALVVLAGTQLLNPEYAAMMRLLDRLVPL